MNGGEEAVREVTEERVCWIWIRNEAEVLEKATGPIGNSSGNGSGGGKETGVDEVIGT
jgi:hypothetical protein